MLRQIALFLPVLLAGILLGAWARTPVATDATPDSARDFDHAADYQRLEQMISSLTEIVNLEVSERRRLEAQIDALAMQVADLADQRTSQDNEAPEKRVQRMVTSDRMRAVSGTGSEVTEARFIDAGFSPGVAERLKREMDQLAMDRLYLRDQAVREGWLGTPRYRDELRALNAQVASPRDDLGPDDYERYLYAMGRPNRIVISSVLTDSPASQSGLRPGDAILSYDGVRTFSPSEIRRETSSGSAGATVAVEILRDGQRQVVYLPRGPMGVNMGAISVKP